MEFIKEDYIMKRWGETPDGEIYTFSNIEGINLPFQVYIPYNVKDNPDLILGMKTPPEFNTKTLEEAIEINYNTGINPLLRMLSYGNNNVCLIPNIPRTVGLQTSYLSYYIYHNDFSLVDEAREKGKTIFSKEDVNKFIDLDKQVAKMIDFTVEYLHGMGINVDDKVIGCGYSAAAKFVIGFSALHTDKVKAIVAGGTGGNHIIPDKNANLTFPLGVSDIDFNEEEFKNIKQFYFIGDNDYNDLTMYLPKYEENPNRQPGESPFLKDFIGNNIAKRNDGLKGYHEEERHDKKVLIPDYIPFDKIEFDLDENGDYQVAFKGYYTKEQIDYIVNNLGNNIQIRYDKMKDLYLNTYHVDALFNRYKGDHETVFDDSRLYEDVNNFINELNNTKSR